MRPLRVGMVFDGAAERYGLLTVAQHLLAALDRHTVEVVGFFLTDGPAEQALAPRCDQVVRLGASAMPRTRAAREQPRGVGGTIRLMHHVADAVRRLTPAVRAAQVDLLHSHYWHTFLVAGMSARLAGCRSVWHLHGGYAFRGAADFFWTQAGQLWADRIFCISQWVRRTLPPPLRSRALLLYNGVPAAEIAEGSHRGEFRRRHAIPDAARLVGAFGGVIDRKGFEFFVQAALQVMPSRPDAWFAIVGDAVEGNSASVRLLAELQDKVRATRLADRFIFAGRVPQAWRLMVDFDVIALPTAPLRGDPTPDFGEGFGLVTAEAMAAGVATVGTACGATPELIEDGVSGLIVPAGDARALARAVVRLLDDEALRRRLAVAAARRVAQRFELSMFARKAEELYDLAVSGL